MSDDSQGINAMPEDLQALLDAAAEIEPAPPQLSGRIWSRLDASVGGLPALDAPALEGGASGVEELLANAASSSSPASPSSAAAQLAQEVVTQGASSAASAAATSTLSISKLVAVIWTASTFAVGTITGAGTHAALTQDATPPQQAPRPSITAPANSDDAVNVELDLGALDGTGEVDMYPLDMSLQEVDQASGEVVDLADAGAAEPATRPVKRPASSTSLEAERLLLARAQRALSRGDGEEALNVIRQHERRFGRASSLAEEREFLRIRALISTGAREQARDGIARFRERYPQSIFLDALNGIQP